MPHLRSLIASLFIVSVLTTCTRGASADEADARTRSRALFVEGVAALEGARARDALPLFEQAYRLFPHYSTLYNIGVCQRSLGQHAAAATSFARYLDEGGMEIPTDERARVAELLAAEEERVATLTLDVVPNGNLVIDGSAATPRKPVHLEPGTHVLEASKPGFVSQRVPLSTAAGTRSSLTIALEPIPATARPEVKAVPPSPPSEPKRFGLPFWAAAGVSGLGFATFAAFGGLALGEHDRYEGAPDRAQAESHRSSGRDFALVADVGLVVGLVSAAVGTYLAVRPLEQPVRR